VATRAVAAGAVGSEFASNLLVTQNLFTTLALPAAGKAERETRDFKKALTTRLGFFIYDPSATCYATPACDTIPKGLIEAVEIHQE
jgi:hypothetical protein